MGVVAIWCECVTCEWKGLVAYGETNCNDCGDHFIAHCYAGPSCGEAACIFIDNVWTCVDHIPVCPEDSEFEHWTVASMGDHEVIEVLGYSTRGVGGLHLVDLTLSNGLVVSVPSDSVFITSERRVALPAGVYGHAVWFNNDSLRKNHTYSNFHADESDPRKPSAVASARWDFQFSPALAEVLDPLPFFRKLETPAESYRWLIRYVPEEVYSAEPNVLI